MDPARRDLLAVIAGATITNVTSTALWEPSTHTGAQEPDQDHGKIVSPMDFGAKGDGNSDDTIPFQKAVDHLATGDGGTIIMPPGVFLTNTVYFPYEKAISVKGCGQTVSKWQMLSPTQPLIMTSRKSVNKRNFGCRFENFGIVAHQQCDPSNTKHIAFNVIGFNDAQFSNIRYYDNESGSVGIVFYTASHPQLTYKQSFTNLTSTGNRGPGYLIKTGTSDDPGLPKNSNSYLNNTNLIYVDGFWVYSNSAMKCAFDMSCCTGYSISRGIVEDVSGHGIILGQLGIVQQIWIENVLMNPIHFQNDIGSVTSSSNYISTLYLSGFEGKISIPVDCTNNALFNIKGGPFQLAREDPNGKNSILNSSALGGNPSLHREFGPKLETQPTYSDGSASVTSSASGIMSLRYTLKPVSSGNIGIKLEPPAGNSIKQLHVSCHDANNGVPYITSVTGPKSFIVNCPNANTVTVFLQISYE